jgi:hypothetical protein
VEQPEWMRVREIQEETILSYTRVSQCRKLGSSVLGKVIAQTTF